MMTVINAVKRGSGWSMHGSCSWLCRRNGDDGVGRKPRLITRWMQPMRQPDDCADHEEAETHRDLGASAVYGSRKTKAVAAPDYCAATAFPAPRSGAASCSARSRTPRSDAGYFVEWDANPRCAVFVVAAKIAQQKPS
jgi:hypothetical protein